MSYDPKRPALLTRPGIEVTATVLVEFAGVGDLVVEPYEVRLARVPIVGEYLWGPDGADPPTGVWWTVIQVFWGQPSSPIRILVSR